VLQNRITTTVPNEHWYQDLSRDRGVFCVYKIDPATHEFTEEPSTLVLRINKTIRQPFAEVLLIVTPLPLSEPPPSGVIDGEVISTHTVKNAPNLKQIGRNWAAKYLKDHCPKREEPDFDPYIHPLMADVMICKEPGSEEEIIQRVKNLSAAQQDMLDHVHCVIMRDHGNPYASVLLGDIEEHAYYTKETPRSRKITASTLRTINILAAAGFLTVERHAPKYGCKVMVWRHMISLTTQGVWAMENWTRVYPPIVLDPDQRAENAHLLAVANWPN